MRILFLAHRFPFPPNKGDKIRSYNILRHLARSHDVHLACRADDGQDVIAIPRLRGLVRSIEVEVIRRTARARSALSGLVRGQSISVTHFYSRGLQRRIDDLIEAQDIQAYFCSSSPMAEYLFRSRHFHRGIRSAVRVMDLIDVDSVKWRDYAERSPPWKAWLYRYEAGRLAEYEKRIARHFDKLLVVSEAERMCFPGASPPDNLAALSNGVDLEYFAPAGGRAAVGVPPTGDAPRLVFTGVMDYWPNVQGVKWFVEAIWPRVRAEIPHAHLDIVGARPTLEVRRLGERSGVTVTGFVTDVREYLRSASVCIAPLKIARGIQNKILEAMAAGKAVITTPQGFEGLDARGGEDIIVAEGAQAFASAAVRLLQDPLEAERIGRNARRCVERNYSWGEKLSALDGLFAVRAGDQSVTA